MERARKGKPVEEEMLARIPKRDKEKLTYCRYLCPRAYSSELTYYYLLFKRLLRFMGIVHHLIEDMREFACYFLDSFRNVIG